MAGKPHPEPLSAAQSGNPTAVAFSDNPLPVLISCQGLSPVISSHSFFGLPPAMKSRTPHRGTASTRKRLGLGAGRVLVYGLGRSGIASAHLLQHNKIPFGFYDDNEVAGYRSLSDAIPWSEVPVQFGHLTAGSLIGYDLVVVSPGVPAHAPSLAVIKDSGLKVIGEIELAYAFAKAPIVAVTGTNGKTTTVTMADQLLRMAGHRSIATGNIGYPFTRAVMDRAPDRYVLEVSSFQLHNVETFAPQVAVITSFAPNHLDWHGDEESYFQAKMNIARRMGARDTFIYPASLTRVKKALARSKVKTLTVGPRGQVTYSPRDHTITRTLSTGRKQVWARLAGVVKGLTYDFRIVSEAAQAVAAIAIALGVPARAYLDLIAAFVPLKHRIETVAQKDGVTWINDSKSTSVDATIFALKKYTEPVVLMLGGRDKGLAFSDLLPAAKGRVKAVIAFGEARDKIAGQIGDSVPIHKATTLAEAIDQARHLAGPGEVVLFSPACASYDQFKSYEERGDVFRKLVSEL